MARAGWLSIGVISICLGFAPGGEWWANLICVVLGSVYLAIYDAKVPR